MSVLCSWASQSEKGSVNGSPGDQTHKEVKNASWYYFGQDVILRAKDSAVANKIAATMKATAENNHIGYGQAGSGNKGRLGLYNEHKKIGLRKSTALIKTKCNCDCSSDVSDACISAGINISPSNVTWTLEKALLATGKFIALRGSKYTHQDGYLKRGDIILNTNKHVTVALQNGKKVAKSQATTTAATKVSKVKSTKLVVDGYFWSGSVAKMQKWLGSTADGILSGQISNNKKYHSRIYPACQYVNTKGSGSLAVKKLQKKVGAGQDGQLGPATIKSLQKYLNKKQSVYKLAIDGSFGPKTAKAFQTFLNK